MNRRIALWAGMLLVAGGATLLALAARPAAPAPVVTPAAAQPSRATAAAIPRPATLTPRPTAEPPPTAAPLPATPPPAATLVPTTPAVQEYTVQAGDTLLGIAAAYGVSMADIQIINDLGEGTLLFEGQTLIIPTPRPGASTYWAAYTLVPGDTLYGLAARFGVDVAELMRVNGLSENDILVVGSTIVIPAAAPVDLSAPPPAPTAPPPSPYPAPGATDAVTPTLTPTALPTIPYTGGNDEWAALIVGLFNEARAANGLPALAYNTTLALAAQGQANDCAQRSWCGHVGSDGADLRTRLARAGYAPIVAAGENWAWNRSPSEAFHAWFDEPPGDDPHRRNILSARYAEVGIGIAPSPLYGGGYYFIADFGHR